MSDYPEILWKSKPNISQIENNVDQLSSVNENKLLLKMHFSNDFVVRLKLRNDENILWLGLLKKLEQFFDNRPNENVILC